MIRLEVTVGAGKLLLDKTKRKAIMRAAGREVAAVAKRMASSTGSGRIYYGPGGSAAKYRGGYVKGRYQASQPGQPPAKVTGTLARSFVVRPFRDGEGVVIRDTAFYALFLESGARGGGRKGPRGRGLKRRASKKAAATPRVLAPRPFLTQALDQRSASIAQRIKVSLAQEIKFVRLKP